MISFGTQLVIFQEKTKQLPAEMSSLSFLIVPIDFTLDLRIC